LVCNLSKVAVIPEGGGEGQKTREERRDLQKREEKSCAGRADNAKA